MRVALRALGVRQLVLAIHDASFPSQPEADIGRGSPYTEGGERFLTLVRDLGFDGIQLGPQGETTVDNPSPYDATIFSRSTTSIALDKLVAEGLLARETLEHLVAERPAHPADRIAHRYAHFAHARALDEAFRRYRLARGKERERRSRDIERFTRRNRAWLERNELFEALRAEYDRVSWRDWRGSGDARLDARLWDAPRGAEAAARRRRAALLTRHRETILRYRFGQFLAHRQHRELKRVARRLGIRLWGDVQIGFSDRDVWSYQALFLPGYCMGAPPSRTNPEGQAWGYPVLDPTQYWRPRTRQGAPARPGPALRLVAARARKLWDEFDGLRIDHPHGLICPWVYRSGPGDALRAVREGARLFSSPNLLDHPELAAFAIARADQLSTDRPRYADEWVRSSSARQVARYATVFDVVVAAAGRHTGPSALACEALSTLPYPVARVLARHRLGRFRVTQKATLENPEDPSRSENAEPPDWIMVGTHDTPPLWRIVENWRLAGAFEGRARYLAERLEPEPRARGTFAQALAADLGHLAHAQFADLFTSPARNVLIFFSDLFGESDAYNAPGTISDTNWALRLASNYLEVYQARLRSNRALNLPRALAIAFRARGSAFISRHRGLLAGLDALAARLGAAPLSDPLKTSGSVVV